jgi:hypothetical protein
MAVESPAQARVFLAPERGRQRAQHVDSRSLSGEQVAAVPERLSALALAMALALATARPAQLR